MERNIVTIDRPIEPDDTEDGAVAPVRMPTQHVVVDQSRVVIDPTADPRGPGFAEATGAPQSLAETSGVQQLRKSATPQPKMSAEDQKLAAFVRDLDLDPAEFGLAANPASAASTQVHAAARPQVNGDLLETAKNRALTVLGALPKGTELFVGGGALDESAVQLVMGIGFLIGKGMAAYRGNGHYCLSDAGRKAKGV